MANQPSYRAKADFRSFNRWCAEYEAHIEGIEEANTDQAAVRFDLHPIAPSERIVNIDGGNTFFVPADQDYEKEIKFKDWEYRALSDCFLEITYSEFKSCFYPYEHASGSSVTLDARIRKNGKREHVQVTFKNRKY